MRWNILAMGLAAVIAGSAQAEFPGDGLSPLAPADCELFIMLASPDRIIEILEGSDLGRLAKLPGFDRVIARPLAEVKTKLIEVDSILSLAAQTNIDGLRRLIRGPIAVAVPKLPAAGSKVEPEFLIAILLGDEDEARRIATRVQDFIANYAPQIGARSHTHKDIAVTSFAERIHVAFREGVCIVGGGWEPFAAAIGRMAAGPAGSLAADPVFRRSMERISAGEPAAVAFLRSGSIAADPARLDEGGRRFFAIAGLDRAEGIAAAFLRRDDGLAGRLFIHARERSGLLRLLGSQLPERIADAAVPLAAKPAAFLSLGIDAKAIWETIETIARQDPRRAGAPSLAAAARERFGISIEETLLPAIGRSLAIAASLPEPGGLYPDLVAALDLANAETAKQCLDKILTSAGIFPMPTEYEGTSIRTILIPGPFAPSFAFFRDRFILATSGQALRGAIDCLKAGGPEPEGIRSDYALSPARPTAASSIDLAATIAYLRRAIVPMLADAMPAADAKLDLISIPGPEALASCLGGYRGFAHADADGILLASLSGIGPAGFVTLLAGAVIGPEVDRAKRERAEKECRARLDRIAAAIKDGRIGEAAFKEMAGLTGDAFLAALTKRLAAAGVSDPIECPGKKGAAYEVPATAFDPAAGPAMPILWDPAGHHPNGRFVLFRGGTVVWMREAGFAEMRRRVERGEWSIEALLRVFDQAYGSP